MAAGDVPADAGRAATTAEAERLRSALARLVTAPDLHLRELEEETRIALRQALDALAGNTEAEAAALYETLTYCCDCPDLAWFGDPDYPSVECANCGFLVAYAGQLVHATSDEEPQQHRAPSTPQATQRSFAWPNEPE